MAQQFREKINNLQTQLENTKTDLAYQSKEKKRAVDLASEAETQLLKVQKTLEAKT